MKKELLNEAKQCLNKAYLILDTLTNYEKENSRHYLFSSALSDVCVLEQFIITVDKEASENNGKIVIE